MQTILKVANDAAFEFTTNLNHNSNLLPKDIKDGANKYNRLGLLVIKESKKLCK